MNTLNHIILITENLQSVQGFTETIAQQGFSLQVIEYDEKIISVLVDNQPALVLISTSLGREKCESVTQQIRERFAYMPVLILAKNTQESPEQFPVMPVPDGICYETMPPEHLSILIRGGIRTGFTIQELVSSNRTLNEISITDALTRIFNRGYMIDRLNLEFKRCSRNREALSCLMVDIDHFKQINDTYGHKFGDVILESVAKRLGQHIRETDIFGRYGGEEFLIILPNTSIEGGRHLAEKLRQSLESEKFSHDCFSLPVTGSFGVASTENSEVITADHLLQLSDRALYKAKESGRNRVCVAGALDEPSSQEGKEGEHKRDGGFELSIVCDCGERPDSIRALLDSKHYEVSLFQSERLFLADFPNLSPDLLLLHACPERMRNRQNRQDLLDLCLRVKQQIQDLFIPMVIVLPEPDESLRWQALSQGADDVIMYQMDTEEFLVRIQSMLRLKSIHDRWRNTYRDLTSARTRLIKVERLTALGEMASGVAHDFNNILSAILGRTQILRRSTEDTSLLKNLDIIEKAASDGAATIRRIQEFSRSTTDREYEIVDMVQVVHDCIQMTRTRWKDQAEMDGIRFSFQTIFDEPLYVYGSATELREVMTNLIMNGLDAMPEGGCMVFEGTLSGRKILLNISDTGSGMDEEVLKRIFDPFFSTKKGEGTGLGLSVAYGIVLRHNGKLECSSTEGEGTIFRIELPYHREILQQQEEEPVKPAEAAPSRKLDVLVVDDEAPIREIFADVLEPEGHQVHLAESGEKALEIAQNVKPDVVFTDLSMPGMSGWEVSRQLKKKYPDIIVVLTSGWGKDFNQDQLNRHGVDFVLPKPVPLETLQSLAHQLSRGETVRLPG